jgi:hypothetical protein
MQQYRGCNLPVWGYKEQDIRDALKSSYCPFTAVHPCTGGILYC